MSKPTTRTDYIVRGILIGGSLGVMAGWVAPSLGMAKGLFLGGLCGILAGITIFGKKDRN